RPVVYPNGLRLDEDEVPVRLGIAGNPKRKSRTILWDGDLPHQALVRRIAPLRNRILLAGSRLGHAEERRVDRVPESNPVMPVRGEIELAHRGSGEVRSPRLPRVP